jgi:transcriptional regulator with XRE-family HTH domain
MTKLPVPMKGVLPDGKKIKELRKKLGKTQKGLIQGSGVELRTYQRAEQGLPILPEILQQIGLLLSADLAQLRLDRTQQPEQENSFRLQCVSTDGSSRLVADLQGWSPKVEYRFAINPSGEVAEMVAAVVECCQSLEIKNHLTARLSPAQRIRVIGRLNDMLGALTNYEVHTYAGSYYTWDDQDQIVPDKIWEHSNEPISYRLPSIESNLRLVFSHQQHPFIVGTYSSWQSKKEAFARAINWNLIHQIKPEWIDEPFDDEFTNTYREAYIQKLVAQGAEPALQLPPPGGE